MTLQQLQLYFRARFIWSHFVPADFAFITLNQFYLSSSGTANSGTM